jgi:hypothetical protein
VNTCPPIEAGTPDLLACAYGRFIGIELKADDNKPTKIQQHRLEQIRSAGGVTFVVRTRVQLREVVHLVEIDVDNGFS